MKLCASTDYFFQMQEEEGRTTHCNEKDNKTESSSEGRHNKNSVSADKDRPSSGNKCSGGSPSRNAAHIGSSSQDTNNHRKRMRRSRWSNKVEQNEECNR